MTQNEQGGVLSKDSPIETDVQAPETESSAVAVEAPPVGVELTFPIVGIGASAGGLAAFEAFFAGMPATVEPGMAFVLVQHLAPDHKSMLTDLVRRYTRMQVFEVEDGMPVQCNCAYIIPPNRDMTLVNGSLQLLEPSTARGQRLPIDLFFRSLARDQRERSVGIILSGNGSDGAQGVRAIKAEGGMVMAQVPGSAEYDGMPRSAIGTGLVDFQLSPAEMPTQLIAYATRAFSGAPLPAHLPRPDSQASMQEVFRILRAQTGHDFSQYKPSTIERRVERRMAIHQIESLDRYVSLLEKEPPEVDALFRDMLIGVTNFFRDPETFRALEEQIIPGLFDGKVLGEPVRVWSAGCSTGEEAYSIAILLLERLEALKRTQTVQVFASDIDARSIAHARAGVFSNSIVTEVSPERLARFFTIEPDSGGYRVHKTLRDMLVFSEHDIIRDPPFTKIDLVCCRNVLIYMGAELQKKLIPLFHYALKPRGVLFLGSSESVGDFGDLFSVLERKAKIFERRDNPPGMTPVTLGKILVPPPLNDSSSSKGVVRPASGGGVSPRELTEKTLVQRGTAAAVLVKASGDIVYLHGRAGLFLEPQPGEPAVNNVLNMARDGLQRELAVALHKAVRSGEIIHCLDVRVVSNAPSRIIHRVNFSVGLVASSAPEFSETPLYLIVLEPAPAFESNAIQARSSSGVMSSSIDDGDNDDNEMRGVAALKKELEAKEDFLQSANEELKSSNEELKSLNEELQSVNEELQSTNEELETSKEELQSVNEELSTVNAEMQTKVLDLSRANNDMNNLLAGTGIGTVFVDHQLRILRFTPAATQTLHLILSDIGRPLGHVVTNLTGYDRLVADTQSVLETLLPIEKDVKSTEGRWHTMRIQPYRTLDNVVEGAVISFVDISEIVTTREALRKANELLRLAVVVRDSHDAITVQDLDGRILAWNPGAVRMYGWTEAEALAMNVRDRIPEPLRDEAVKKFHEISLSAVLEPYVSQRLTKDGRVVAVSMISTALINEEGRVFAISTTERLQTGAEEPHEQR